MPVNLTAPVASSLHPVAGVRIGVAEAGVRKANRKDLTVFLLDEGASVGGVFTSNRFCAAPVQICRERLDAGAAVRAIVVNTGNANAGTGEDGLARARQTCEALAAQLKLQPDQVLPFSTGVIMEPLPVDRIVAGLPAAIADAQPAHWARAAEGIMTTDTVPKAASAKAMVGGVEVTITGISKGAGMIRPNMATMLGFLATDAKVDQAVMKQLAFELAEGSFNRVTIDGDTSTNDSFIVIATNKAANAPVTALDSADGQALKEALMGVARQLARLIAEGSRASRAAFLAKLETQKVTRDDLSSLFEGTRLLLSSALLGQYGVSVPERDLRIARSLASRLTKAKLLGTIDLLQDYRNKCTYNVGVGPTLGGFAVELEETL